MTTMFGIYSVAYSGMRANQAALTATSDNIANIDTTGASKVTASSEDKVNSQTDGTYTESGVDVASIVRARDRYLDSSYRSANADAMYLSVKNGNFAYMSTILSEYDTVTTKDNVTTSASGVEAAIDDFFGAWQTASTSSTSADARADVVTAGSDLVEMLTDIDSELQALQTDAVNSVKSGVDSLNDYASQVAELNGEISAAEVDGGEASYLRDQRDALVDDMSSLANISVNESDGNYQITINGASLVNGTKVNKLEVDGSGKAGDSLIVKWTNSGTTAGITSGSIKGYLEDADQTGYSTIDTTSLPYSFSTTAGVSSISTMRQALNDLITTIATNVNSLTKSGVDKNGDAGVAFFTAIDSSEPLSITNIQVNPALSDASKLALASSKSDTNSIANAVCALQKATCYESDGSPLNITEFYTAITSWLGTAGDTAKSNYTTQAALAAQLDNQRQSVSGISIDEEMSNMIKYQEAYAASARVMTTIDNCLGDLLDQIG